MLDRPATCPFCSLHCADLQISVGAKQHAPGVTPACPVALAGYSRQLALISKRNPSDTGVAIIDAVIARVRAARSLLVILSGDLHQEAVSAAVDLAETARGALVCDEDLSGSRLALALGSAGCLTATIGEMFKSSRQLVLAGVSPGELPPRLKDLIGQERFKEVVRLASSDPLAQIQRHRLALRGERSPAPFWSRSIDYAAGGVILYNNAWLQHGDVTAVELLRWAADLNRYQRWYAAYLPPAANSIGVVDGLLSRTGYPGNLHWSSSGVVYDPRITNAENLILRQYADVCLVIGDTAALPHQAQKSLAQQNCIFLNSSGKRRYPGMTMQIAHAGVDACGSMARFDGVQVKLPAVTSSNRARVEDLLSMIKKAVSV